MKRGSGGRPPGGWWSWVVLAGAGLAAAGWLRHRGAAERAKAGRALPPPAAGEEIGERPDPKALLRLPADVESAWLPAPAGSVRVAQRHVAASVPIVFVHGLGGSLEQWAPALASLGEAWRGVAFDLPGHGRSDAGAEVSVDSLAAALGAVIDGLGLRRVVLVAHSLGTAVALRYAGQHRHRVAGLLLVDPNGDQTQLRKKDRDRLLAAVSEDAHDELGSHFRQVLGHPPAQVRDAVLDALEATPPGVLHASLAAGFAYSPLADLDRYDGPVRLVLSPLNDLPYSLHNLRPQLRVVVQRNVGHWLMLERPDAFARVLERFLGELGERLDLVH